MLIDGGVESGAPATRSRRGTITTLRLVPISRAHRSVANTSPKNAGGAVPPADAPTDDTAKGMRERIIEYAMSPEPWPTGSLCATSGSGLLGVLRRRRN
jgi:hypothetical protein